MYPRYAEKVPCRYRSASSLAFSTMPCESWAGRAGLHGLDGRSRVSGSAAFVHSCPPNVTLLPCNGIQAFAAARLCRGVHGCEWRGREELAHPGLVCMHGRVASLGSIILLHTHLSTAPHFRQPSGPARRLSQLTLAWCCVFVPYLIIPPPHYSCCPLFYYCYDYRDLLFFILVPVLPLLLACLPACLLLLGRVNCCSPDRKSSRTSHRIASAHLQAHLRHLPHSSSAPAQDHSCPPSTFIFRRRRRRSPPTTSSIGSPALTCCARLDHSSTSTALLLSPPGPRVACPASLSSTVCR